LNRFRKHDRARHRAARSGLSAPEIAKLDHAEEVEVEIIELARKIHAKKYSEEYDHYFDSNADANDRKRGANPMSADHISKVSAKRKADGVSALSANGMSVSLDSWDSAHAEAESSVRGR
jgi:hypothetical protein